MIKSHSHWKAPSRYLLVLLGIALLVYLVYRAGANALLQNVRTIGWGLSAVIALAGVSHVVKTWAWRLTLAGEAAGISFSRMFGLRLVSEAIGQLGLPGQVAGEATRVALLGPQVPVANRILSVTLDRGLFIATGAVVMLAGILSGFAVLSLSGAVRMYAGLFAIILVCLLGLAICAIGLRWRLLSRPAHALDRLPWLGKWIESKKALIHSIEEKLLEFHRREPAAFWGSVSLNFVCHALAVLEVYLILFFLGARVSFIGALVLEAFTKVVNLVGAFNPGNIGTYEGGTMLVASLFGLNGTVGLTLGLCRRMRGLFWGAAGAVCFVLLSRSMKEDKTGSADSRPGREKSLPGGTEGQDESMPSRAKGSAAIILTEDVEKQRKFTPELAEIGSLPILLRVILGARSENSRCIIVVPNLATKFVLRRALLRTGRFSENAEWFQLDNGYSGLPQVLGEAASKSEKIVLMFGGRLYHPSLHQMANKWDGAGGAAALVTGTQLVGIYALSREAAMNVSKERTTPIATLEDLHNWLTGRRSVVLKPVTKRLWQPVESPRERLVAECKLDRWLVKPTDGIWARMNRKVSIPISRQLIKFPITPNMVTLFTLAVSFAAGLFFAFGGYWSMVVGAFLSVAASILDGCDGEVARLKLQVSKFGCWLETVCDYLYYLFIFAGIAIGLARSAGTRTYLVWGALLLFGAVTSFVVISLTRQQVAAEQPEQFLRLWQKKAEGRKSNFVVYVARNTEFIIRRCFLPYAFLVFALLNVLWIALIASAIGANLVWLIALYSSRALYVRDRVPSLNPAPARAHERIAA